MMHESETPGTPPVRHDAATGGFAFSGPPPETIRARRDFLACARALRHVAPGMIVQARPRSPADGAPPRVGYTCSKKVGNSVARNRAKRRLREAARALIGAEGRAGWDYVLIGRSGATAARPFAALVGDLDAALRRLHRKADAGETGESEGGRRHEARGKAGDRPGGTRP